MSRSRSHTTSPNPKSEDKSDTEGKNSPRRSTSRGRQDRSSKRTRSRSTGNDRSRSRSRDTRSRSLTPRRYYYRESGYSRRPRSPIDEDGYRIHIADLDSDASKRDLEKIFGRYGPLREIWMARSIPCFAFVVFRHKEDAVEAVIYGDNSEVNGKRIKVTHARPRTKGRGRRGFDPSMRCYQCGDRGHFSRDCPDSKYGYKRHSSPRRSSRKSYDDYRRSSRY